MKAALSILNWKPERALGVTQGSGRYDLPLNQGAAANFLILLVALMTFLATMAVTSNFALQSLTHRWTSGLEHSLTIEVPAARQNADVRSAQEIETLLSEVGATLKSQKEVSAHKILSKSEVRKLLEPWLGEDIVLDELPLPGLVSVELKTREPEAIQKLEGRLRSIAADIRLDRHEDWLGDILRLAGTLQFFALIVMFVIGVTTIVAIAGGIRSRMAEHYSDIELLHLMGASDHYISRQFQRHALLLSLKGSLAGLMAGLVVLGLMMITSQSSADDIIPKLSLSVLQFGLLLCLPGVLCLTAALTARLTVLRALGQMP